MSFPKWVSTIPQEVTLLRGMRAFDQMTYTAFHCQAAPALPQAFPHEGVNLSKYDGGYEGLQNSWREILYVKNPDGSFGDFKNSVSELLSEDVAEAFAVVEKCDVGPKDGTISLLEWTECQKDASAEDQAFDLQYLAMFDRASTRLATEGIETYPTTCTPLTERDGELKTCQDDSAAQKTAFAKEKETIEGEKTGLNEKVATLETQLDKTKRDAALYKDLAFYAPTGLIIGLIIYQSQHRVRRWLRSETHYYREVRQEVKPGEVKVEKVHIPTTVLAAALLKIDPIRNIAEIVGNCWEETLAGFLLRKASKINLRDLKARNYGLDEERVFSADELIARVPPGVDEALIEDLQNELKDGIKLEDLLKKLPTS